MKIVQVFQNMWFHMSDANDKQDIKKRLKNCKKRIPLNNIMQMNQESEIPLLGRFRTWSRIIRVRTTMQNWTKGCLFV